MKLSQEEQRILDGRRGSTLQKIMRSLVLYSQALGAERFVDIEGPGHFALHHVLPGIGPRMEMLDELVQAGLRTKYPFTLDPRPPLDFENLDLSHEQEETFRRMFRDQARFDRNIALLRTIEAIRMFAADNQGQLPGSLADITLVPIPTDPVTGRDFIYRRINTQNAQLETPVSIDEKGVFDKPFTITSM